MADVEHRLSELCKQYLTRDRFDSRAFVSETIRLLQECGTISVFATDDPATLHFLIRGRQHLAFPVPTSYVVRLICASIATLDHEPGKLAPLHGGTSDILIHKADGISFIAHADFDNRPGTANQWFCLSLGQS